MGTAGCLAPEVSWREEQLSYEQQANRSRREWTVHACMADGYSVQNRVHSENFKKFKVVGSGAKGAPRVRWSGACMSECGKAQTKPDQRDQSGWPVCPSKKKKKKKKKLRVRVEFLQASLIDCLIFFLFPAMSQWHDRWAGGRTRLACGWCVDCAWVVRAWCGCRAQNGTEGERVRVAHGQRGWRARRSMPIGSGCHSNAPPNKQRLTEVRERNGVALNRWVRVLPGCTRLPHSLGK